MDLKISTEFIDKVVKYSKTRDPFKSIKDLFHCDNNETILNYSINNNIYNATKNFLEGIVYNNNLNKKKRWEIAIDLVRYSSLDLIIYWFDNNENLEEFNYNTDNNWDIDRHAYKKNNFFRSAIINHKYSVIQYFCSKYKKNFWELFFNNIDINLCIYHNIDLVSFFNTNYKNSYFINSIFNIKIDNQLLEKIVLCHFTYLMVKNNVCEYNLFNMVINYNNDLLENYIEVCCINRKYHLVKRIFTEHKNLLQNNLSETNWQKIIDKILGDGFYTHGDNYIKVSNSITGILCILFKYLKSINYKYTLLTDQLLQLVILYNPLPTFKYLNLKPEDFNNTDDSGFTPLIECARYGSYKTFLHLYEHTTNKYIVTNDCLQLNILSASCYNNDIRIMKFILDNYHKDIQLSMNLRECLGGMNNCKRFLKKLKLLGSYYNIDNNILLILNSVSGSKTQQNILDYYRERLILRKINYKITDYNYNDAEQYQTSYNILNKDFYSNFNNVKFLLMYVKNIYKDGTESKQFFNYTFENIIGYKFNKKWLDLINQYVSYNDISIRQIIYNNNEPDSIFDKIDYIKNRITPARFYELRLEIVKTMNMYISNDRAYIYFIIGAPLEQLEKSQFNEYLKNLCRCRQILKKYIRLKFKKNEIVHKNKLISSINEIEFSPFLNKSIIKNKLQFSNPEHIKIEHILVNNFLYGKNLIVSEKADGLTKTINLSKNKFYPPLKRKRENLRVEYIKDLNIHFVFDIDNDTNLHEKYNYLMSNHSYADYNVFKISNIEEFYKYREEVLPKFKEFCDIAKQNKDNKIYWWPKPIWNILLEENELLDFLENITDLELNIFPTDGWIITSLDKSFSYKLKPSKHLTIDLLYTGTRWIDNDKNEYKIHSYNAIPNKIYRCYYNNKIWESRELREEKRNPNNKTIVEYVMNCHNYNFRIKDLKEYTQIPYYQNFFVNKNKSKNNMTDILSNIIIKDKHILDLGCGYNYFYNKKIFDLYKSYTGIDMDYNVLKKMNMNKNNKTHFRFLNFNNSWLEENMFNSKPKITKFDIVLIINTIHYSINEYGNINSNFLEQLYKYTNKNSRIFISFCDKAKLSMLLKKGDIKDGANYVNFIDNNTIKYYYSWTHNKPNIEKIISYDDLILNLSNHGFKLINDFAIKNNKKNNSIIWKKYLDCFSLIEVSKS